MKSGGGLSDRYIVELVVHSAPERIKELIGFGVPFSRTSAGDLDLALEGGHSESRVVHADDNTGHQVVDTLLARIVQFQNIQLFENRFAIDLLETVTEKIGGLSVFNTELEVIELFAAKMIVLATGGSGQVYQFTTNANVATGDGVAMALRAGALVTNMNHIQFHPTAFLKKNTEQMFLISEAVRGFGAYVINQKGERFLFDFDPRAELATRDIVSKAIFEKLKKTSSERIYLDCRHLNKQQFVQKFPAINEFLENENIDVAKDLIPIMPAAHYQCGGIKVNERGQTNLDNLFAIGECADTGLHGANRLASNSLLEALVFAHETAEFISYVIDDIQQEEIVIPDFSKFSAIKDSISKNVAELVKNTMSNHVTIFSTTNEIITADLMLNELNDMFEKHKKEMGFSLNSLISSNIMTVAKAIIEAKTSSFQPNELKTRTIKKRNIIRL
jgi:L-aspartate oxidase